MALSINIFIFCFMICGVLCSKEPENKFYTKDTLPSYQILLNAQFACSNDPIKPYKFVNHDPNEPFVEIAPKIWGVVKNIELSDRKDETGKRNYERLFRLKYTKMGLFRCGEPIEELSQKGIVQETLPFFLNAYKKPGLVDTLSNDPLEIQLNETLVQYLKIRDGANDGPAVPGRSGMPCLVKLEDVLKNPKVINLDILCKDESKKAREFTEKEIKRAIELWKENRN